MITLRHPAPTCTPSRDRSVGWSLADATDDVARAGMPIPCMLPLGAFVVAAYQA